MNNGLTWTRDVLSNGLTVLQYPKRTAMTAQLSIAVKYGSNDDMEKVGTAHFIEHMLVGGSTKRIGLHHQVESMGGCVGFETTCDSTFVSLNVFSDKLFEASKIVAQLLFDSDFENDKFELERKVIQNEIAEVLDDPSHTAEHALVKCLFPKHPIRRLVSGTKQQVKQLSLYDVRESHYNHYIPRNIVVILTGNYSETNKIIEMFSDKENYGLGKRHLQIETEEPRKRASMKKPGINQAYLSFGLRTPPARDDDTVNFSLINSILGLGESSRLFIELREKRALTYDFTSSNSTGLDYGYFAISCALRSTLWKRAQTIIETQLERLTVDPVPENELQKSKNQILAGTAFGIDDPQELPRLMADTELMFSNEKELSEYIEKIKRLTSSDIIETARRYFRKENYSTAIVIPK